MVSSQRRSSRSAVGSRLLPLGQSASNSWRSLLLMRYFCTKYRAKYISIGNGAGTLYMYFLHTTLWCYCWCGQKAESLSPPPATLPSPEKLSKAVAVTTRTVRKYIPMPRTSTRAHSVYFFRPVLPCNVPQLHADRFCLRGERLATVALQGYLLQEKVHPHGRLLCWRKNVVNEPVGKG